MNFTQFTKSVVDTCVRDKSEMPFVELRLTWEGPEPPPEALKHRIDVIGIEGTAFLDLGRNIHQPNGKNTTTLVLLNYLTKHL